MQKTAYDPGLTQRFDAPLRRAVNKDGSFNVRRSGVDWRAWHPWLHVVSMTWTGFASLVLALFLIVNTGFALVYFWLPADQVQGSAADSEGGRFLNDFFFSSHTLTTVGYGNIYPNGVAANIVASVEALAGLLGFAVITGLLIARVSRPSARIAFSAKALISPYQDGFALMFRIANERSNNLMEIQARVLLMTVPTTSGKLERKFEILTLERPDVLFFPLTWTVVHPIDESSPLAGKTAEDLARLQAEIMILVKGFDETFSQTVHSRYSYRFDEVVWSAKFQPAFRVDTNGDLLMELDKLGEYRGV